MKEVLPAKELRSPNPEVQVAVAPVSSEAQGASAEHSTTTQAQDYLIREQVKTVSDALKQEEVSSPAKTHPAFQHKLYVFREKFFNIFGKKFDVRTPEERTGDNKYGDLAMYVEKAPFRKFFRKDKFTVYSDKSKEEKLLEINNERTFDAWGRFVISDPKTQEKLQVVEHAFWDKQYRDTWRIYESDGVTPAGKMLEKNLTQATLARRYGIPQEYDIVDTQGNIVAELFQHADPFVRKYDLKVNEEALAKSKLDRRTIIGCAILRAGAEHRQQITYGYNSSLGGFVAADIAFDAATAAGAH